MEIGGESCGELLPGDEKLPLAGNIEPNDCPMCDGRGIVDNADHKCGWCNGTGLNLYLGTVK